MLSGAILHIYNNNNYHYYCYCCLRLMAFSRTTWLSWYHKMLTILDYNEERDNGWHWHQLDHMLIICTALQTDNHHSDCTDQMHFLLPNQEHGNIAKIIKRFCLC